MEVSLLELLSVEMNCSLADAFGDAAYGNASDFLFCNATADEIGTCWPRSGAGRLVARSCPDFINGVKYNSSMMVALKKVVLIEVAVIVGVVLMEEVLMVVVQMEVVIWKGVCTENAWRTGPWTRNERTWASKINYSNCEPIFEEKPWCRLITTVYNYFVVTNFFWMFVEGCYLHTAIVMTYSTDKLRKWLFLFIGWCIPCPIIIAWAVGKLYHENEQCWFGKEPGKFVDYIYQGPVIIVLLEGLRTGGIFLLVSDFPTLSSWKSVLNRSQRCSLPEPMVPDAGAVQQEAADWFGFPRASLFLVMLAL
ncbi:Corticotropin-releasing factor receptor 2 [Bagarius yarrelli]|uniref:Corticotropin-releasing factor receptor 2 n=1 Tax=Bagarius yarrelli TaxID=175774 RepID=A0A556V9D0_BAGYA|nr:Corticotropin-releasing factor receptor 2 [Bagarius yarrelli]